MSPRTRMLRLPHLSLPALAAVCSALVALCIGVAIAMRGSLTDYNSDPAARARLPLNVPPVMADRLAILSDSELREQLAGELGADAAEVGIDDGAMLLGVTREDLADGADVVVTGIFTGERTYVYQAFVCQVCVTSVISGEGIRVGDIIGVYEGFKIVEPKNYSGQAQFSGEREVSTAGMAPSLRGVPPFAQGREYLFFLRHKTYPAGQRRTSAIEHYTPVYNPYGTIDVEVLENPDRVLVGHTPGAGLTFGDAAAYDILVWDEDAKDSYLAGCRRLLERYLSMQSRSGAS